MLVLCDKDVRSKWKVFKSHLLWSCLRHETLGGVMQFEAVLGTNILDFERMKTNLQRTICHMLDYGIKPQWAPTSLLNGQN